MKAEPYLCFNGVELANALRTLTYMRRGLIDARWTPAVISAGSGPGYQDLYSDIYTADPYSPADLAGYCAAMDFSLDTASRGYVSPAADDAPWYSADRPESGDFMGMLLTGLELQAPFARAVQASGPVGAALGRLTLKQRVIAVKAIMFAASSQGMAYGERWLADVLAGNQCDPLTDLGDLVVLPACQYGFRTLKRCGVVDGPVVSELGSDESVPSCVSQRVDFQLASELPWLLADADTLTSITLPMGDWVAVEASTDAWTGDAGLRLTASAYSDFSCDIAIVPLPDGYSCPTDGLAPAILAHLTGVPGGNVLTWDSAIHSILEWDETSKVYTSGFPRVTVDGGFQWLELPPCTRVCIKVTSTDGSAVVQVDQVNREL